MVTMQVVVAGRPPAAIASISCLGGTPDSLALPRGSRLLPSARLLLLGPRFLEKQGVVVRVSKEHLGAAEFGKDWNPDWNKICLGIRLQCFWVTVILVCVVRWRKCQDF